MLAKNKLKNNLSKGNYQLCLWLKGTLNLNVTAMG